MKKHVCLCPWMDRVYQKNKRLSRVWDEGAIDRGALVSCWMLRTCSLLSHLSRAATGLSSDFPGGLWGESLCLSSCSSSLVLSATLRSSSSSGGQLSSSGRAAHLPFWWSERLPRFYIAQVIMWTTITDTRNDCLHSSGGSLEEATEATPPRDFRKSNKINYY